jgi:pyruvate kinase
MINEDIKRRTKIVCTIGPSSASPQALESMLRSGMNVARLNFSHGTHYEHAAIIKNIRQVAAKLNKSVAIMQDLPGPKDRTGKVKKGGVILSSGSYYTLTTRPMLGDESRVSVDWVDLPQKVKKGDSIYISDGMLKLEVVSSRGRDIRCRVIEGGRLGDNKGVNVPGLSLETSVTADDYRHIEFGLKHGVDIIAISFIRKAYDVLKVRGFLDMHKSSCLLIAKIERSEALQNLEEIMKISDAAMVARGDLGIEIPIEKVPVAQKMIVEKCNRIGKPVIVATQMLESMVESPRPTRAEVTDVANAIYDGADAIMLSEETAIGKYPSQAIQIMSKVALEVEQVLPYDMILMNKGKELPPETDDAISYSACHTARQLQAKAIVAFTSSGSTARRVSKYRPQVPILAITSNNNTMKQLCLSWGVNAYKVPAALSITKLFSQGVNVAVQSGVVKQGDLIVITGGVPVGVSGSTNMLKVERI